MSGPSGVHGGPQHKRIMGKTCSGIVLYIKCDHLVWNHPMKKLQRDTAVWLYFPLWRHLDGNTQVTIAICVCVCFHRHEGEKNSVTAFHCFSPGRPEQKVGKILGGKKKPQPSHCLCACTPLCISL